MITHVVLEESKRLGFIRLDSLVWDLFRAYEKEESSFVDLGVMVGQISLLAEIWNWSNVRLICVALKRNISFLECDECVPEAKKAIDKNISDLRQWLRDNSNEILYSGSN